MNRSPEGEARRIAGIRAWAKNHVYPKGYSRPREHVQPMLDALKKKMTEDPEKYRAIAISNLPKNTKGDRNGRWRGGIAKIRNEWRNANSAKLGEFRKKILKRDRSTCRDCGSTSRPEVHHIVPIAQCRDAAFLEMNGIVLCKACHKKTDSYCGKGVGKKSIRLNGTYIITIPHRWRQYDTVGNWAFTPSGLLLVFISDVGDTDSEFLVALHEMVEAYLCKKRGISEEAVTAFDMAYEATRPEGDDTEPGDDPSAPYHTEHKMATDLEMYAAAILGVPWEKHEEAILRLA